MIIQQLFSLTQQGKKDLYKTTFLTTLHQISVVFPIILLVMLAEDMIKHIQESQEEPILLWGYLIACIILLVIIFGIYLVTYMQMYINSGTESAKMRLRMAEKFRKLPLSYLGEKDLSDFTSTLMDDVSVIEKQLTSDFANLVSGILSSVFITVILAFYNWQMALALFLCMPISLLFIILSKFVTTPTNRKNRQLKLNISEGLQEFFENIKVIKSSSQKEQYIQKLIHTIKSVIPWAILYEVLVGIFISISYNILRIGLGIVVLLGTYLLEQQQLTVLGFILFIFVAVRIYDPLTNSLYKIGEFIYSLVSANRIKNIFKIEEQGGSSNIELTQFDIEFRNVAFGYNDEEVIHDVSFTAKQGEITALVGPSGCGKSTLAKLSARFWDIHSGEILIDGHNINEIHPEKLLSYYSIVFQDVILFNDTVFNNIKIGNSNATDEEVYQAAAMANCTTFIKQLPEEFDTVIGENGQTLSGGERQRLSIARAFLKQSPIVLLDEATASLDPENEILIQNAISELIKNKTVIVIAHRLKTIEHCDQIVVLKEGKIEEKGKHEQLMANEHLYHHLVSLQRKSGDWQVNEV
ncbi:TPA: ABC transporter ATP-binding protein [Staphylococcus aureus]|uniref:ABC transporter ATP-binding protein n=1 Tax=Staphylococcus aureus TaxID=1280 RepID=UPI00208FAE72|nr:ABC transporter ATP-binding protein [Staphylococcus aureus]MCO4428076.1 ABC transporter ATP-binding protein [Staphylococcus aureus]UXU26900.1 ABC transporter ATP-binding protein/permease [Staphylococcus aureus]HCD1988593.1 ABC transporter ATP-binding protein [Staphylococcus aureus]HCX9225386.1 ABC transporter ATP-binding protein [Staphylococcus aureus]HDA7827031.1 ABC transporter ATP-binding protein [Staphylococcus aureus]